MNAPPNRPSTVSVFMCNYNHGKYIAQAIEAVLSQSRPPDEFVIVDDGSTDNSVQVIEAYASRNRSIRFARNERNLGIMATMHRALGIATGDYVFWTSADDYVLPGLFEKAMRMAEKHPEAGIIAGGWVSVDESGREIGVSEVTAWKEEAFIPAGDYMSQYLMKHDALHTSSLSTLYRRSCLEEVGGFRDELGSYSDTFALRAIALGHGCAYIPGIFACWRTLDGSYSHTLARHPRKMLDISARCVWLMRHSEFRDRFNEDYIRKWEREFRDWIIRDSKRILGLRCYEAETYVWGNIKSTSLLDRFITAATFRVMEMNRNVAASCLRHFLRKYAGDTSCYTTAAAPAQDRGTVPK